MAITSKLRNLPLSLSPDRTLVTIKHRASERSAGNTASVSGAPLVPRFGHVPTPIYIGVNERPLFPGDRRWLVLPLSWNNDELLQKKPPN